MDINEYDQPVIKTKAKNLSSTPAIGVIEKTKWYHSIRTKVMLIAAAPLAFSLLLSAQLISNTYSTYTQMEQIDEMMQFSVLTSDYVHETQKEREATGVFVGSGGEEFRQELIQRRLMTDQSRTRLLEFVEVFNFTLCSQDYREQVASLMIQLHDRDGHRVDVDHLVVSSEFAAWFYTMTEKINLMREVEILLANDLQSRTETQKSQTYARLLIIIAGASGISLTVIFLVYLMGKRIVDPIVTLLDYSHLVAQGDLEQALENTNKDETGALTRSFNTMVESLSSSFSLMNEQHAWADKTLHDSLNHKTAINEHAFVSMTDVKGNITYVNDKFVEISGYSREELIGQSHRMINSGEHDTAFFREMWKTIASKKIWNGDVKNRAKDGSYYWVNATIIPFRNGEGKVTNYFAIRTDISEAKFAQELAQKSNANLQAQTQELLSQKEELELMGQAQEMLTKLAEDATGAAKAADQSKSEFLANMSHEIRTPMTAILGFAETLSENIQDPENVEAVSIIQKNGTHLLTIINDILDLSKLDAGKMTIELVPVNPCELVTDVISLVKHRAEAKGLSFDIKYFSEIPETIETDPTRLRQVLINLIGNAIKFTEQGGITLGVHFEKINDVPVINFDVIDTGIGMTDDQISKLFQPFAQADSSTTRKFGGTGLGLTISKRFAALLGGDISIPRSVDGEGTTFRATVLAGSMDGVNMLADPSTALEKTSGATKKAKFADLTGIRVLLAEDGPDNQKLISFVLKKAGAEVSIAENGKIALDMALDARSSDNTFDCILMDMQMPVMSGYESATALREANYTAPIIALTAHAMAGDREKCINAGCDDFANKPIDRKKLISLIAEYSRPSSQAA